MSISERLRLIIKQSDLSKTVIAEKIGVNRQYLYAILSETSEKEAPVELTTKIGTLLGVNLHWLLTGEGEMYFGKPNIVPPEGGRSEVESLRIELLSLYRFIAEKGLQIPPHITGVQNTRQAV